MWNAVVDELLARPDESEVGVPVEQVALRVEDDLALDRFHKMCHQRSCVAGTTMVWCGDDPADAPAIRRISEASGVRDERFVRGRDPDVTGLRFAIAAVHIGIDTTLFDDEDVAAQPQNVMEFASRELTEAPVGYRRSGLGSTHGSDSTHRPEHVGPNSADRRSDMAVVEAEGRSLYAESFGDPEDPCMLLINGMTSQLTSWPEPFCEALVDRGFFVIRFDNRDVGLSTKFVDREQYTLADMADDCVQVLRHFDTAPAHVFGMSMGGMIAQIFAIEQPDMMLSMTSYASCTANPDFGNPTEEALVALLRPAPTTREEAERNGVEGKRVWGTPDTWSEEEWATFSGDNFDRCPPAEGSGLRQFMAIDSYGQWDDALRTIDVPTLVIHGSIDPLINPDGGQHTASLIPDATYVEIEGMGHDLPITEWPHIVSLVTSHAVSAATGERARKLTESS